MKFWKGQLVATAEAPPLVVDILLDISNLTIAQHLILTNNSTGRKQRIRPEDLMGVDLTGRPIRKQNILLETWQLTFSEQIPELPLVYKKCIIFFRSLFSFLRLMPSFKLCKRIGKMASSCKIIYRVGSTRTNSPYDAGLDQLHSSNDMRLGLAESDFDNLETPLGVFHLHATYRLDCDFDVDDSENALDRFTDLEPHFFHVEEISKRRSSLASLQVSERDSITRLGRHSPSTDYGKSRTGSIPKSREGVSIPNRGRWKDTSFGKNSLSSVSPDTQFRIGTAPSRGYLYEQRSITSPNFVPFTPPTSDPIIPFNNDWLFKFPTDPPPFSTPAPESESSKFVMNKPEFLSESPPFAIARQENYEHTGYNSPDVEHFLSSIDQARTLKITSAADKLQQSILAGSKGESSVHVDEATRSGLILEKPFHSVWATGKGDTTPTNPNPVSNSWTTRDPKAESNNWKEGNTVSPFDWKAEAQKAHETENISTFGPEQKPFDYTAEQKPFQYEEQKPYDWKKEEQFKWDHNAERPFDWDPKDKPFDWDKNDPSLAATRTKSRRGRQRSVTSDWQQRETVQLENLSRSESFRDSKYDEDELVFNMSEIDL
ncbi:autophagy protein 13 [Terramyces sp. JEL0728]|nr:autophagy protein 13 [Terramyces sp. JEL0728]